MQFGQWDETLWQGPTIDQAAAPTTRQLSDPEIFAVLQDHTDVMEKVQMHEARFGMTGSDTWDQIRAAANPSYGASLPIPPRGLAFEDHYYGTIIVFPDARGMLHFVVTNNKSLVEEVQKPVYTSDPQFWQLFSEIAAKYRDAASVAASGLHSDLTLALGIGLIAAVLILKK